MAQSEPVTVTVNPQTATRNDPDGLPTASTYLTDGGTEESADE